VAASNQNYLSRSETEVNPAIPAMKAEEDAHSHYLRKLLVVLNPALKAGAN
jgi:hypothetical protein